MKKIFKNLIIAGIIIAVLAVAGALYFFFGMNPPASMASVEAKNGDITEKINLTGQVKASQGVDLAFEASGKIVANYVKAGDKIYAGQTLAVLDQGSAKAALTIAQGSLAQAQANYDKLLAGATPENIKTAQDSVNSAKQNLANAYNGALNTLNNSYTAIYNAYNVAVSMQNNYFASQDPQGIAVSGAKNDINTSMQSAQSSLAAATKSIAPSDIDGATTQMILSLNNVYNDVNVIRTQCDLDVYYYKVTAADKATLDGQKTALNAALTGATALQQSIASLKLAEQAAEDQLNVITAPPTQENIEAAKAQVLSAQGQVDSAQAVLNNTVLSAPFSGQVDKDNAVVGQIVSPNVPVATVSNDNLEIDTDIPEIDMAAAKIGDKADVTLDAFGNGVDFPATVVSVDSAPTIVNGISAYGAKLKFDNSDTRIEPGMTANINVISETHSNVLVVPISAVMQQNNKYFVIVDNGSPAKESREVTVGLRDDKNIEITSGLKSGEKVLAY
ncbi:MAG: efflux RND transporter periplasmic adaptor subunit [Candidatus Staskawiczbacteria bacterium]|jgi:HlyD family secretion protein